MTVFTARSCEGGVSKINKFGNKYQTSNRQCWYQCLWYI